MNLPADHVRFYQDGVEWPDTPEKQAAERAYRKAFLGAAREAARWQSLDKAAIDAAWAERKRARTLTEVLIPSTVLFDRPGLESEQIIYHAGHEAEAARTRGRVHGFEFVRQCHDELLQAGVDERQIGPVIVVPWVEHVAEWVARDIDPERIAIPPRPDDRLTERQRQMLAQAKEIKDKPQTNRRGVRRRIS